MIRMLLYKVVFDYLKNPDFVATLKGIACIRIIIEKKADSLEKRRKLWKFL